MEIKMSVFTNFESLPCSLHRFINVSFVPLRYLSYFCFISGINGRECFARDRINKLIVDEQFCELNFWLRRHSEEEIGFCS